MSVDWLLSMAVSSVLFPAADAGAMGLLAVAMGLLAGASLATPTVFGVSTAVLVAPLGHAIGHRLVGVVLMQPGRDGQRPRMPLRSGRALKGSTPFGMGNSAPPRALRRLVISAVICLVSTGRSF